jgi:two-component system sensor histidine kinase ChiS
LPLFKKGVEEYYNKRFTQASVLFQEILDVYPEDKTTRIFLENSAKFMVQGVSEHWDGVDIVEKIF